MQPRGPAPVPGLDLTPLARRILVALVAIYVAQLVLEGWLRLPVSPWLGLNSIRSGTWFPWQPFTALLLNVPAPLTAFLEWLVLAFFLGPVERLLGTRRLVRGLAASAIAAAVGTELLDAAGLLTPGRFLGLHPIIEALLVFFGLSRPNATILLMFVLPIQAAWMAWGSGLLTLLYFLAFRDLGSSMALFGWVGAYLWMTGGGTLWQRFRASRRARRIQRDLDRLTVLPGGRDDDLIH